MPNPDGITTSPPTCIFCESTQGPFDVEDVFPKWVRTVLPEPISVTRTSDDPSRAASRPSNVLEAKIRKAVCNVPGVGCNGGWMSLLERDAKPVLSAMMNPHAYAVPVNLNRSAQRTVAFWAMEKALCLELSLRQSAGPSGYRPGHLTPEHFRWLYDHRGTREPPPGTQVWLFAFNAQERGTTEARMASHGSVVITNKMKDQHAAVGFLSTFTIGTLGFQVFGHDIEHEGGVPREPERLVVPGWLRSVLIPIWPILNPTARWLATGPAGVVTLAAWDSLVTWGPTFQPP